MSPHWMITTGTVPSTAPLTSIEMSIGVPHSMLLAVLEPPAPPRQSSLAQLGKPLGQQLPQLGNESVLRRPLGRCHCPSRIPLHLGPSHNQAGSRKLLSKLFHASLKA